MASPSKRAYRSKRQEAEREDDGVEIVPIMTAETPPDVDPIAALDDALAASDHEADPTDPPNESEAQEQPRKRRGRPPGRGGGRRRKEAETEPIKEPPPPRMIASYGMAAAGTCRAAFRIAGRFIGGSREVWEVSSQEMSELAEAFGPMLALHHDKIGAAMPYAEPVLLLYQMFSERHAIAKAQVATLKHEGSAEG